jgi:hypothetical protein
MVGHGGSDDDDLSSLSEEGDPLYLEGCRIASNDDKGSIKANLERVLGEVLEQIGDDGNDCGLAFD